MTLLSRFVFDGWSGPFRIVIVGFLAYAALVLTLRITGKRTLTKMNAFDLVVTVALGSTLATILLSKDVALAEGVTAFAMLAGLQYVVAWLSVRSRTIRQVVKSEPRLLVYRGEVLHDAVRHERITLEELTAAARSAGFGELAQLEALVLETDGSFSAVSRQQAGDATALHGVEGMRTSN